MVLSWEEVTSYGEAFLCGYQLHMNGEVYGDVFAPEVMKTTVKNLLPGMNNLF